MHSLFDSNPSLKDHNNIVYKFVMSYLNGAIAPISRGGLFGCLGNIFYDYSKEIYQSVFRLLDNDKNSELFDVIINACCGSLFIDKSNSKWITDSWVAYFKTVLSEDQTPNPVITNAFLSNAHFRTGYYHNKSGFIKIMDAMLACYKKDRNTNEFVLSCLNNLASRTDVGGELSYSLYSNANIKMLSDPDYLPVFPLIAEMMCFHFNNGFLDYLEACDKAGSVPRGVIMGIAYFSRRYIFRLLSKEGKQYCVDLFRILLDMFKNDKMESWFKNLMLSPFDGVFDTYISRVPMIMAKEIFADKDLAEYYHMVFAANYHYDYEDMMINTIDEYMSRDLKTDVSRHIRVYETIWNSLQFRYMELTLQNRQIFDAIRKRICRRGAPALLAVVNKLEFK